MSSPTQSKRWRLLRRGLLASAVVLTLIAGFYTEEGWRGKRAWENCKRELEAKGIKMHQEAEILAPVAEAQNVLAVPEMQQWFLGVGATDFRRKIDEAYGPPASDQDEESSGPTNRMVLADVVIGMPGSNLPPGYTVLSYGDPLAKAELSKMIKNVVGPYFRDPYSYIRTLRGPKDMHPAKILLLCQTAPTIKELEQFLPDIFLPEGSVVSDEDEDHERVKATGDGSYEVTMQVVGTVGELQTRLAVLEPQFAVMRQAFQRPYVRMLGDHPKTGSDLLSTGSVTPELARTLSALAQCHLLEGRPEEALRDLTLSQDVCRLVDEVMRGTYGLLPMLEHATVTTIDIYAIEDGLSRHAWRESQLAAFEEQFQKINFVSDIKKVMLAGPARVADFYPNATAFELGVEYFGGYDPTETNGWTHLKMTVVGHLIPRGWVYQNMAQRASGYAAIGEGSDPAGQIVYPNQVDAVTTRTMSRRSPYNYLARMHATQNSGRYRQTAELQTTVHEAIVACALERYRLVQNEYPAALDALVPQYLAQVPRDLFGGLPLRYRRVDDGRFVLYSVGWNGTDDGGKLGSVDDLVWDDARR